MNLLGKKGYSVTESEEQAYDEPPLTQETLMRDDDHSQSQEHVALVVRQDARQTVRLLQCRKCSKILTSPVTLPCGHTVCRGCLPFPVLRENISYPNTPDRQLGIKCPLCDAKHPTGDCCVDVAFAKIMDLVHTEVKRHQPSAMDTPAEEMEGISSWPFDSSQSDDGQERTQDSPASRVPPGSLLVLIYWLAHDGRLAYDSDIDCHGKSCTEYPWGQEDESLLQRLNDAVLKELDCLVCYNLMLEPTTTGCGHTFCRRCLARGLDHSTICPICRKTLHVSRSLDGQPSNQCLIALINTFFPSLFEARLAALTNEEQAGNDTYDTPLFVCTLSLPTMPTFLHIFEPKYRLMIRRCLNGNRQFGMIMYNRSAIPQGDIGVARFMEYGTLLQIVNFELLQDGRSFVETRGIGRFRVRGYSELDGYYIGNCERIDDVSLTREEQLEAEETEAAMSRLIELQNQSPEAHISFADRLDADSTQELLAKAYNFVLRMRQSSAPWLSHRILELYGEPPNDAALFPYWFAGVLPIADEEKYLLLRTTRVRERLKIVNTWIHKITRQRWPSGSACRIL